MLDREYTKDQILERYLNTVFFGNNAYGIQAAAETYFGKTADQLTFIEAAFLAGLVRSPSGLRPDQQPRAQPGPLRPGPRPPRRRRLHHRPRRPRRWAPTSCCRSGRRRSPSAGQPADVLHRGAAGLPAEQVEHPRHDVRRAVQHAVPGRPAHPHHVQPGLPVPGRAGPQRPARQRPGLRCRRSSRWRRRTGAIRAMVGGRGFVPNEREVNMALRPRQTGSSIKLFVLAAALQAGAQADDIIDGQNVCTFAVPDQPPFVIKDATSAGRPTRWRAMTWRSINCAYVRLAQIVGLNRVVDTTYRMAQSVYLYPGQPAERAPSDRAVRQLLDRRQRDGPIDMAAGRPDDRQRRAAPRAVLRRLASTPPTAGASTPTPMPAPRCSTRAWPWPPPTP